MFKGTYIALTFIFFNTQASFFKKIYSYFLRKDILKNVISSENIQYFTIVTCVMNERVYWKEKKNTCGEDPVYLKITRNEFPKIKQIILKNHDNNDYDLVKKW